MKRFTSLFALTILFIILSQPSIAQGPRKAPLPNPPAPEIVQGVVDATNGAQFTPLYLSSSVVAALDSFGEPFSGITLDTSKAVHYITIKGDLLESLIPVAGLGDDTLEPNMIAPRKKPKPGKPPKPGKEVSGMVIGAWFQPQIGARWIVVTFKANGTPDKIRFYKPNNGYSETSLKKGKFKDDFGDGQAEQVDEGAVIADKRSCITVGLDQVCWGPVDHGLVRDETKPKKQIDKAVKQFAALYDIGKFDSKNAVPDLLGLQQRADCAAYLGTATVFSKMAACKANAVLATAKGGGPNDPIALLIVRSDANIRTYNAAGQYIGDTLPADKYLVLATPVSTSDAGTPTALFLVGLSGNTYLIPSTVMQGFGEGAIGNTGQAGIRDGFARYRLFGW